MDKLPEDLLLDILSRLDSTDIARCRSASKGINTLYPHLRSLNLRCTLRMCYPNSCSRFKTIFLDLISNMPVVESVCIGVEDQLQQHGYDVDLIDDFFLEKWLPRVSVHLKSLSVSNHWLQRSSQSYVLPLLSASCHNLAVLKLKNVSLSLHNLNPMPMMRSLTLEFMDLLDTELIELIKCVPNLQILNLTLVKGLEYPKIHLFNLKIFRLISRNGLSNISVITPNLVTLMLECSVIRRIHIQSSRLSHFHLDVDYLTAFRVKKFEYLRTFTLSACITSILYELPVIKTVENLTMDSPGWGADVNSKFILGKLFTVFPNVNYLCIKSKAWRVLEAWYKQLGAEQSLYLRKKLKTFSAYLWPVDPSLTFSCVDFVLSQCIEVSNVSFLIHGDVDSNISKRFKSRCRKRWPELKWRWGNWK